MGKKSAKTIAQFRMMIRSFNLFVFICLFFFSFSLSAQDFREGYIIQLNGDSIAGLLAYPNSKKDIKSCLYKKSRQSNIQNIKVEDLIAYGFNDGRRFEAISIKRATEVERSFSEVLVKGKTSLFELEGFFYFQKDSLIKLIPEIRKEIQTGTATYNRIEKMYISQLNFYMIECNVNANNVDYNQRQLTEIVANYNKCLGSNYVVFKDKIPWMKIRLNAIVGYTISNLKAEDFDADAFKPSTGFVSGVGLTIYSPRINDRFNFSGEAILAENLYQGFRKKYYSALLQTQDVVIKSRTLKLPIGFKYNLFGEGNTPFINGGLLFQIDLGTTFKMIEENELNGVVEINEIEDDFAKNGQNGIWLGLGYTLKIKNRLAGYIDFRYEGLSGSIGNIFNSETKISNLNAMIGLRF